MSDVSKKVESIRTKLEKVNSRLEKLASENELLRKNRSEMEREIRVQTQKIEAVQADYNRLKLAKTLVVNTGEKAEMKFRVNELVREIDKCIALLNR